MQNEDLNLIKKDGVLSPTLDVVFQALFGEVGSENITRRFLEAILKQKVDNVDLSKNPILRANHVHDKVGILDIVAKINNSEYCNIEMQFTRKSAIIERILYYWSKIYSKQLKRGDTYSMLQKTIVILIADFNIDHLKGLEYHTSWKIIEEKYRKTILTDKLEVRIIELPKIRKMQNQNDELLDWLFFLKNPKCERVVEKMKVNKELKQANDKLQTMSEDETMERLAWWRYKAILDENTERSVGFDKGKAEGLEVGRKEGLAQGKAEGRAQGRAQGIVEGKVEGRAEATKEIVINLIKKGFDVSIIEQISGLSKEEINDLLKEIHE